MMVTDSHGPSQNDSSKIYFSIPTTPKNEVSTSIVSIQIMPVLLIISPESFTGCHNKL